MWGAFESVEGSDPSAIVISKYFSFAILVEGLLPIGLQPYEEGLKEMRERSHDKMIWACT